MRNEALPLAGAGIQITGIARIAEKLGVFLLLLIALIIMVTWLSFAARAEKNTLEVETQVLRAQPLRLRDQNIVLLEQTYAACLSAGSAGFFRSYDWEVLTRGP